MTAIPPRTHTWKITIHYHRCPACGYIMESRQDYVARMEKEVKDLECPRCHHLFTVEKQKRPSIGPFFGEPEPAEITWEK